MSIVPLPVFEADADPRHRSAMTDAELYASLEVPKTLVVRFGRMKNVGEFPYDGDVKPGCGTKLVARTPRGTEVVEMLTTTCANAGCGKSVTRKEMLEYIDNSGGKDFPFHTKGRVLRVATIEDLNKQSELETSARGWIKSVKQTIATHALPIKLVEVEPILGMEVLTLYYMSEDRVDFRDLVKDLAAEFQTRIEMRQVGARDEARLVADYERCGQHCCCKNFLKVLKPISMRAAKMQKATLDPLKISGRCGRLMCCLRYEDATYKELKSNLPHRKTRVGTPYGPGLVLDGKILAQLVLVKLEHNQEEVAVPVENLMDPETCPTPEEAAAAERAGRSMEDPLRGLSTDEATERTDDEKREKRSRREGRRSRGGRKGRSKDAQQDAFREKSKSLEGGDDQAGGPGAPGAPAGAPGEDGGDSSSGDGGETKPKRRRGRRRRGGKGRSGSGSSGGGPKSDSPRGDGPPSGGGGDSGGGGGGKRRRRRGGRGRRRGGGGKPGGDGGGSGGGPSENG